MAIKSMFLDSNKAIYGRFKAPANPVDTPRSLKSLKIGFDLSMIVLTKVIFAPFGFVLALVRVRVTVRDNVLAFEVEFGDRNQRCDSFYRAIAHARGFQINIIQAPNSTIIVR